MITALQLIFSPFETWEKITTAQRGSLWILFGHLVPLLLVALGIESFLLNRWGEKQSELGFVVNVPVELAIRYGVSYFVLLLGAVLVSAKFMSMAGESFNVQTTFFQSFLMMAYGFGPIILARILDGFPLINSWLCWVIGAAVSISVLYHGIGMVLRPDQTKGFGLYLISIVIVVLTSGLSDRPGIRIDPHQTRSVDSEQSAVRGGVHAGEVRAKPVGQHLFDEQGVRLELD